MEFDFFDILTHARKLYAQTMEDVCAEHALTRNELDILLFLANNPQYDRAADIVAHRGIVKSHVSLSVTALETKGFLVRREDGEDRRTVHLKLTELAQPAVESGRARQQAFFQGIHGSLTPEELAQYRSITKKIYQNIQTLKKL